MSQAELGKPNPRGEALVQELLWVHGIIRDNLATIDALVKQIDAGAPGEQVRAQIDDLAANSAVWTLRINCLQYCSLVHHHHRLEDVAVFPGLRRVNPDLQPVIDKLEADHVVVGKYLDEVEAAAARLSGDEAARAKLTAALKALGDHLLTHLAYEEENISPTLRTLSSWPRR